MAKKKQDKKPEPLALRRTIENVRHYFNDDELIILGSSLNRRLRTRTRLQDELASIKSGFKSRTDTIEIEAKELSTKLHDRWEMRDKKCYQFYKDGRLYWFLCDDIDDLVMTAGFRDADELLAFLLSADELEPVKERPITEHERQQHLFDDPDEPIEDAAAGPPGADDEGPDQVETN